MYNLHKKIQEQKTKKNTTVNPAMEDSSGRVSVRDKLLIRGTVYYPVIDAVYDFIVIVSYASKVSLKG